MKTEDRLAAIQARCAAATPGPWNIHQRPDELTPDYIWSQHKHAWNEEDEEYNVIAFPRSCEYGYGCDEHIQKDAEFIAHARSDIPWLLARVRELDAERDRLAADLKEACERIDVLCSSPGPGGFKKALAFLARVRNGGGG